MKALHLIPQPKSVVMQNGTYIPDGAGYISLDSRELYDAVAIARATYFADCELLIGRYTAAPTVRFEKQEGLHAEGYVLTVAADGIAVRYSTVQGAFYAFMTLNQLMDCAEDGAIPCCVIEDEPAEEPADPACNADNG